MNCLRDYFRLALLICFSTFTFSSSLVLAAESSPQTFTLDGQLLQKDSSLPLVDSNVSISIQILDPTKKCVLYEEQQVVNTSASNGYFNVQVGSNVGSAKRTVNDSGHSMTKVFQNTSAFSARSLAGETCVGATYTPQASDTRYFRLTVTPSSTGVADTLLPDTVMDSVPNALVAQTVQGLDRSGILQVNAAGNLTQTNLEGLLTGTGFVDLSALIAGTSEKYVRANTANGTGVMPSLAADPTSGLSPGQIWYDSAGGVIKFRNGSGTQTLSGGTITGSSITSGTIGGTTAVNTSGSITTTGSVVSSSVSANSANVRSLILTNNDPTNRTVTINPGLGMSGNFVFTWPLDDGTANQVLTTDGAGVLSWTSPGGAYTDANARAAISGASPLSYNSTTGEMSLGTVGVANGGTGTATGSITGTGALTFAAGGTNQNVTLTPSGTGYTVLGGNVGIGTTSPGSSLDVKGGVRISGATSGYVGFAVPAVAGSATYTWPAAAPGSNMLLQSDSSGVLSWVSAGGGGNAQTANPLSQFAATTSAQLAGVISDETGTGAAVFGASPTISAPTLTGVPIAPTAAVDTNTTQLATTAFVLGQASSTTPVMNGTAAVGTGTTFARADHVHPTDTSRAPAAGSSSITTVGTVTSGTWNGTAVAVGFGGTGLSAGTSGGVPYYNSSSTMASSGALTANGVMLGGGPGAAPTTTAAPTANGQVLRWNGTNWVPNFVSMFDMRSTITGAATFGSGSTGCTSNQTLTWTAATDNLACTNISLPVAQISGTLPIASGGTNNGSLAVTAGGVVYTDGSKLMNVGVGTSGQVLTSNAAGAPTWTTASTTDATKLPLAGGTMTGALVNNTNSASTALAVTQSGAGYAATLMGGNVGIGTTSPGASLDVKGGVRISGATSGYVGFAVPAVAGSATYTWPAAAPASNMMLQSDNTGALSWVAAGGGGNAFTANPLSQFAATTSAQLAGVISDETGSGAAVFGTSPTISAPTFTGVPVAPTAAVDTNTTQLATTAFVLGQASSTTPVMNGTAAVGTGTTFARANHVHPTDTSRAPAAGSSSITTLGTISSGTWNGTAVAVGFGGTGLSAGTSGGVPYFNSSSTMASSSALTANGVMLGGGAGAAPTTTAAPTANGQVLRWNGTNWVPNFVSMFDLRSTVTGSATFGSGSTGCTSNQTLTWTAATDNLACTNISLPVAQISGTLPIASGGTNNGSLAVTAGGVVYTDGSKLMNVGVGTSGQVLTSNAAGAPTWTTASTTDATKLPLAGGTMTGALVNNTNSASTALAVTQSGAGYAATLMGGNVGIGTTSPGASLDVKGGVRISGATSGYVGFAVPAVAGSATYTWPSAAPGSNMLLQSDSSGVLSWISAGGGGNAFTANPLSQFAATTSAQLAGVISDETGTGAAVFGTSPTISAPTFTGVPVAPTAAVNTNTTQLATTAFVLGQASSTTPVMDGTAAVGTGTTFARSNHVHPTDTSRAPAAGSSSITTVGTVTSGTWNGTAVAVGFGGTGLSAGTSGGVPYYNSSSTMASSSALTANGVMLGGGAGAAPTTTAAPTANGQVLRWNGTNWVPNFVSMFDMRSTITGAATFGSGSTGCTSNQTLTWTAATDNLACTNISLPVAQISGTLPIASGGTNNGSLAVTAGGVVYTDGSKLMNVGVGTSGQVLTSNAAGAPTWTTASTTDATKLPLAGGTMTGALVNNTNSASTALAVTQSGAGYAATLMGGNVGIGTTSPVSRLQVTGAAPVITINDSRNQDGFAVGDPQGSLNFSSEDSSGPTLQGLTRASIIAGADDTTGARTNMQFWTRSVATFSEKMRVDQYGNVGIGTTSPSNLLSLGGAAARTMGMERNPTAATAGQGFTITSGGAIAGTADLNGGDLTLRSGISTGTGSSSIHFQTATAGTSAVTDRTPTTKMTILGSGNVGIGTTSPGASLDVKGGVRISGATSGYVGFAVPAVAGSATYTWPAAAPASNMMLQSDNTGALSWVAAGGGGNAFTANPLSQFAATTSAQLAGVISDETGSGAAVFGTSPTISAPTFTGVPVAPTAAVDTNTTQLATTAFVLGQASSTTPVMNGTAAVGTGTTFARANHVHPTDTSRAPAAGSSSITTVGTVTSGTWNGTAVAVGFGGTGLSAGTSGGVPYFNSTSTMASSGLLTANGVMLGGGAGAAPTTTAAPTANGQVLRWNGTNWVPNFVSMFDMRSTITGAATFGSGSTGCTTNQTLTWTAATDNLACTNISLPVAQISGTLPIASGGTNNGSLAVTAGGVVYTDGSKLMNVGVGTSGQVLTSNAAGAPTWTTASTTDATKLPLAGGTMTGPLNGIAGAAGNPSVKFGSINTGFFAPAADTIAASINNTEAFRINSSGNVGIGTLSPTNILSFGGNSVRTVWMERHTTANTAGNNLTLQAGGATTAATDKNGGGLVLSSGTATGTGSSTISFQTATAQGSTNTTDNAPTTKMTILGSGNVGIGTTSPGSSLDVKGGVRISGATSGYVGFAVPAVAGSATYTWPAAVPASNMMLQSDNTGALSWVAAGGGGNAFTANPLSQFAATTSAQLAGVISDETGSGAAVFGTSPTISAPTFTGVPVAPTAAVNTNTTQLATTAFVLGQASSTTPVMDGTAAVGTGTTFARSNHVHPTDTSRAPAAGSSSITTVGTVTSGTWNGTAVAVGFGGTGLSAGTSGGVPYFNSSSTMASSGLLTANGVMLGGGAGAAPTTTAAPTANGQVLRWNGTNWVPNFVSMFDLRSTITGSATFGSGSAGCTSNQTLTWTAATDNLACTNISLPVGQISGTLPIASGGTNNGSLAVTAGGVVYTDGSKLMNVGVGTSGQVLTSNAAGAPTWTTASTTDVTKLPLAGGTMTGALVNNTNSASTALAVTQSGAGYAATLMGGSVGIGTTTPTSLLDVAVSNSTGGSFGSYPGFRIANTNVSQGDSTTTYNRAEARVTAGSVNAGLFVSDESAGVFGVGAHLRTATNHPLGFWTNNSRRMTISSSGDVGIGTSGPVAPLHIRGSQTAALPANTGTTPAGLVSRFSTTPTNAVLDVGVVGSAGAWLQTTNLTDLSLNYPILLNPNGGGVGIGTASPGATLDVKGGVRISGATSGYVGFAVPAIAGSATYTWPSAAPASNMILQSDNTGTLTWISAGGGGNAQTANPLSQFAATTSAQLLGVLSDETGTGAAVFGTSPTISAPTFTGVPVAPTAAVNTNTTQLATTAFVLGQASSTTPVMDGTAAVGTGTTFARSNHVHPTDTSRAPAAGSSSITTVGTVTSGTWNGTAVAVGFGGTGLSAGTSGGVPYFNSTSTMASSGLLTANGVMLGGGAGAAPTTTTAPTASGQVLRWNGTNWVPNFVSMFDMRSTITGAATFGSGSVGCTTNQTLTWTAATDNLACTNISLPVGQITGTLPIARGGTNNGSLAVTAGGVVYTDGSKLMNVGVGTTGQFLTSNAAGAPTWTTASTTDATKLPLAGGTMTGALVNNTNSASTALAVTQSGAGYAATLMGGNVGIGTTAPTGLFQVYGSGGRYSDFQSNGRVTLSSNDNTVTGLLSLRNTLENAGNGVGVFLNLGYGGTSGVAGTWAEGARIIAVAENTYTATASTQDASLRFLTSLDGSSTEKVRITSAGNVGIGTTSPNSTLDALLDSSGTSLAETVLTVQKSTTGTAAAGIGAAMEFRVERADGAMPIAARIAGVLTGVGAGAGTNGALAFSTATDSTNTTEKMRITSAGDVGIGTISPNAKLDVAGGNLYVSKSDGSITYFGATNSSDNGLIYVKDASNALKAQVSAASDTFFNGGNVGIGTASPTALLHVQGSVSLGVATPLQYVSGSYDSGKIRIENVGNGLPALSQIMGGVELVAKTMSLGRMTPAIKFMSSDADLTTENPKNLAGIVGRATETYAADTAGGMAIDFMTSPNSPGINNVPLVRMTVDHGGNVGIGVASPQAALDVVATGTSSAVIVPRATTVSRPTTLVNGMIRYNTTTALFEFYQNGAWVNYTTVSDGRLKTNVTPVTQGLGIINQLNPVYFDWDQNNPRAQGFGSKHQVGFIAQEVEKVLPEVVNQGEDSFRSVEYGKIVSVVVAALKELYAKVVGQDEKIQTLDRSLASVNAKLEADNAAKDKKIKELEQRLERIEKALNSK